MNRRPIAPLKPERKARVEEMIADGCPLSEIARTLKMHAAALSRWYPEARMTPQERGEYAAMSRKFNQIPDTIRGVSRKAA